MSLPPPALLALEDGTVFRGLAFGAPATVEGECVFNTSLTGYEEILHDPSYFGQIVTLTAVQIGNYGINAADAEAAGPKAGGLVVRELSAGREATGAPSFPWASICAATGSRISEVDTRALTKRLRVDGAMKCCLSTLGIGADEAVARARAGRDMAGADYVQDVTCNEAHPWERNLPSNHNRPTSRWEPAGGPLRPRRSGFGSPPSTTERSTAFTGS